MSRTIAAKTESGHAPSGCFTIGVTHSAKAGISGDAAEQFVRLHRGLGYGIAAGLHKTTLASQVAQLRGIHQFDRHRFTSRLQLRNGASVESTLASRFNCRLSSSMRVREGKGTGRMSNLHVTDRARISLESNSAGNSRTILVFDSNLASHPQIGKPLRFRSPGAGFHLLIDAKPHPPLVAGEGSMHRLSQSTDNASSQPTARPPAPCPAPRPALPPRKQPQGPAGQRRFRRTG